MLVEKERSARKRRAFVAGAASIFEIFPKTGTKSVYGSAGQKRDADNLSHDWQNLGKDISSSMRLCGKYGI